MFAADRRLKHYLCTRYKAISMGSYGKGVIKLEQLLLITCKCKGFFCSLIQQCIHHGKLGSMHSMHMMLYILVGVYVAGIPSLRRQWI